MMHAFDVLGDPIRRRILELLSVEEMKSGEIVKVIGKEFGIGQSGVSQHLKILRECGFAHCTATGTRRIYSLDPQGLKEVDDWLSLFRHFWTPKLEALATEVARGKKKRKNNKK